MKPRYKYLSFCRDEFGLRMPRKMSAPNGAACCNSPYFLHNRHGVFLVSPAERLMKPGTLEEFVKRMALQEEEERMAWEERRRIKILTSPTQVLPPWGQPDTILR